MNVLIGHTGFVGSTLARLRSFDACFNSSNIEDLTGQECEIVVCAGVSATMWLANNDPESDWAAIDRLLTALRGAQIRQLVLISTIAVFDDAAAGYDENTARYETKTPYGRHRRQLEEAVTDCFEHVLIMRLPALFGNGLKKNFIYDLLNPAPSFLKPPVLEALHGAAEPNVAAFIKHYYRRNSDLDMYAYDRERASQDGAEPSFIALLKSQQRDARFFTNHNSRFQFYDLSRLEADLTRCLNAGLTTVNMTSEPLRAADIAHYLTGDPFENNGPEVINQNIRSVHASLWGAQDYMYDNETTLRQIKAFARANA